MCTVEQEDAFRFARGEEITTTHGLRAKLARPLDFLVLTDHAEMYGLMPQLKKGDQVILSQEKGRKWYDMLQGDDDQKFKAAMEIVASLSDKKPPIKADKVVKSAWKKYTALADKYNEPGRFTALIGYEYTTFGGYNLHRNVVFRGDASVANQTVPFSQYDSQNPEDLWQHLDEFQKRTGAQVLAIPHNGNLSNGRMFSVNRFDGKTPYGRELAEQRARLEPIVEFTQIKGDGETHPMLSPNDEFADFDTWDKSNLNGTEAKTEDMLKVKKFNSQLLTGAGPGGLSVSRWCIFWCWADCCSAPGTPSTTNRRSAMPTGSSSMRRRWRALWRPSSAPGCAHRHRRNWPVWSKTVSRRKSSTGRHWRWGWTGTIW